MHSLRRLLTLLALCAVSSLSACKDGSSAPPGENGPGGPPGGPVEARPAEPPPAGDAVPSEGGVAPIDPGTGANVICTADKRAGGVCTREYQPVCGTFADSHTQTFANKCTACSDEKVASYVEGPCPGEPTG